MASVTDPIPGSNDSYNETWRLTSQRVFAIWDLLFRDVIPGPSIDRDGTPYTPEEVAANPNRYFKSYLKDIQDEIRLMGATIRAGHVADATRDVALAAEVTQAIGSALLSNVPAMAEQIASRIDQVDEDEVRPVIEQAIRGVLGSLNDAAPGPEPTP